MQSVSSTYTSMFSLFFFFGMRELSRGGKIHFLLPHSPPPSWRPRLCAFDMARCVRGNWTSSGADYFMQQVMGGSQRRLDTGHVPILTNDFRPTTCSRRTREKYSKASVGASNSAIFAFFRKILFSNSSCGLI